MRFATTFVTDTQVIRTADLGIGRVVDTVVARMVRGQSRANLQSARPEPRECYRAKRQPRVNLHAPMMLQHLHGHQSGKPTGTSGGWRGLIIAAPAARSESARIS